MMVDQSKIQWTNINRSISRSISSLTGIVGGRDHDADDGVGFGGSYDGEDSHAEHDVVEFFRARAKPRRPVGDGDARLGVRVLATRQAQSFQHFSFFRSLSLSLSI